MKSDYITYKQATNVSIGGLLLQAALASALFIYGVLARDHTAISGSIFAATGILAWLTLAIVFDQHRRERIEAMEAEALAVSPTAGTSVFSAGMDDFRPAAKRLAMLHKYFVPSVAIVIGLVLLLGGVMRFRSGRLLVEPGDFTPPLREGWALGLGLTIVVIGFVVARYAAGLAKFGPWANLRAGASFAVGTALIGLSMAIANFIDLIGPDVGVRWVQVIVPALLVVVGAETFLNFILGIYRPRKAGEIPRPAFDSRLLGLLAAPDRIAQSISDAVNYQLGFDVSSGWFYKLLSRALVPLIVLGFVVVWLLSCIAVIRPHQRGLILRFGAVARDNVLPGVHFKWPWPIESVYIPEYVVRDSRGRPNVTDLSVTGLRTIELGTMPPATKDEPILWTNDHAGEEVYQLVRSSSSKKPASPSGEGSVPDARAKSDLSDFSVVSVELPLQYVVRDVRLFDELGPPLQRDEILKTAAQRELLRFFQSVSLDDVLGATRLELSAKMRAQVQAAFDRMNIGPDGKSKGAGVEVIHFAISGVHPPKDVAGAFETPVQADQNLQAKIEAAHTDEIKSLTGVAGDVKTATEIVAELDALDKLRDAKAQAGAITDQEFKVQRALEGAGGSAASVLAGAQADRWNRHMTVRGIAARQLGRVALFEAAPAYYRANAYFTTLHDIMQDSRLFITPEKGLIIDFDYKDKDLGQDIFKNDTIGQGQK